MEGNLISRTQTDQRTAHTLLLRMAADEDRAKRIYALKERSPGLTWQQIADHTGVSLRAAQAWAETGEIAYSNAKKLAELFDGVDVDYVMRGSREPSPDLMGTLMNNMARLERKVNLLLTQLPETALTEGLFEDAAVPDDAQAAPAKAKRRRATRRSDRGGGAVR